MSHLNLKRTLQLLVVATLFVAVGCSDDTKGRVTGLITVDGEPAEQGYIGFAAIDGKTGPAGGKITNGEYDVVLPVGAMKVDIRVPKVVGQQKLYDTADSPVSDVMEESLPRWYNDETELTYEVVPGESVENFELSSSKKRKKK